MANSFVTMENIAKATHIVVEQNIVSPLTFYRQYSGDFLRKGNTIQVKKPTYNKPLKKPDQTTTLTTSNYEEDRALITLNGDIYLKYEITDYDSAVNLDDLSMLIHESIAGLCTQVNEDGLAQYKNIYNTTGTAGVTPAAMTDFTDADKVLNDSLAPPTDRYFVFDTAAQASLLNLTPFSNAYSYGQNQNGGLKDAKLPFFMGFQNLMSQGVQKHTAGTAISSGLTLALAGAASKGAESVLIDTTGTGTLAEGDIIIINGQNYTVTADASLSSTAASVKISPNLAADASDNTAVTYIETSEYTANLAYHNRAFAFVQPSYAPMVGVPGAEMQIVSANGINIAVYRAFDTELCAEVVIFRCIYGFGTVDPTLAVRVLG